VDLSRYTLPAYMRIVTYKTAFYSFYLPVACGLLIGGHGGANELRLARSICVEMGQYFQARADLNPKPNPNSGGLTKVWPDLSMVVGQYFQASHQTWASAVQLLGQIAIGGGGQTSKNLTW